MLTVEVKTTTPRAAGQVNVGKWSTPSGAGGLGCARVTATDEKAYEGTCQVAGSGEVRFYSSTGNVYKFWGVVWMLLA